MHMSMCSKFAVRWLSGRYFVAFLREQFTDINDFQYHAPVYVSTVCRTMITLEVSWRSVRSSLQTSMASATCTLAGVGRMTILERGEQLVVHEFVCVCLF